MRIQDSQADIGLALGWVAALMLAGGVVACRGDQAETGGPRSMTRTPTTETAGSVGLNHPPVIDEIVIRPAQPVPGRTVQATARVSDPDGDTTQIFYRWQTRRGRVLSEGRSFDTTGLPGGSRLEVIVTATDNGATNVAKTRAFRLAQSPPAIGLVVIDSSEGTKPGAKLMGVVEISNDAFGRVEAELEWKVNGEGVGTEEDLETQRFSPGDIVILQARLTGNARQSRPVSSSPVILSRGDAPEISSKPRAGIDGGLFRYQIRASSGEPDAELTYELLTGPDGMMIDAKSGLVQWRPEMGQRGRFDVEVSATDQWGSGVAQSFSIVAGSTIAPPASAR